MSDFSNLPRLALWLIRALCIGLAGLLAGLICAFLWLRHGANGFSFQEGEQGSIGLMLVLLVLALLLARLAGRELKKMIDR